MAYARTKLRILNKMVSPASHPIFILVGVKKLSYRFHDFIMEFQQGYATIINENSSNLSGGQRQLIALARAVYSQPQLLLLDEATAAMGRRTEKFVIELLNNLKKEIPVVFVTHRPQLARYTDRIYVIENKTVSAFGNHTDLIKSNSFYRAAFEELIIH